MTRLQHPNIVHLYQQGVLWRDLKPSNMIVATEGRLILLDFGISSYFPATGPEARDVIGTPSYMAPEQPTRTLFFNPIAQAEPVGRRYLIVTGELGRRIITLDKERLTIGRSVDNDIVLDDHDASRYHTMLTRQASTFQVIDLNSANGTYLNRERISAPINLKDHDQIRIGSTVMVYVFSVPDETVSGIKSSALTLPSSGAKGHPWHRPAA